ncbi:hypothetical protein HMPREF9510_02182, partial [Enterococcus faecalis TX0470]
MEAKKRLSKIYQFSLTAWLLKFTITAVKKREKVKRTSEFR